MKLSKVFTIVLGIHVGVIAVGLVFIQSGCQNQKSSESYETTVYGEEDLSATGAHGSHRSATVNRSVEQDIRILEPIEVVEATQPVRFQPTRPPIQQWNAINESEPEVIIGNAAIDDNELNPSVQPLESLPVPAVVSSGMLNPDLNPVNTVTYTVVKGDNLTKIARAHQVDLKELMAINQLNKNSVLNIGQVLLIPDVEPGLQPARIEAPIYESPSAEVDSKLYSVVSGDTLSRIAARHGTTVSAIKGANQLTSDRIYVGQDLLIPVSSSFHASLPAASKPSANTSNGTTYKVQKGDSLSVIAQRFGVSVGDIMAANGITDPRKLYAGQTIKIPNPAMPDQQVRVNSAPLSSAPRITAPVERPKSAAPVISLPPVDKERFEDTESDLDAVDLDEVPYVPVEDEQ